MPSKLSLRKNIAWNSSGSLVYLFFQWLVTYLVVILLGFDNAGIFSLAVSISTVAFAFALYGIRGYQVSDVHHKFSNGTYLYARLITSIIAVSGVLVYVLLYGYDSYTTFCIMFYLLFKVSEAYADVYHGIVQKAMRMDFIGKSLILRGVVTNIVFIITAILTRNLLLSIALQAVVSFVLIFLYDRRKAMLIKESRDRTSWGLVLSLLTICLPLAIYSLLSNLLMSIPRISLESSMGSEVLGIYASVAIPAAIIQVVAGFIFSPVLTVFADYVNQKNFKSYRNLLVKTLSYILVFSLVAIFLGATFGDWGLKLLFGEKISSYTYLFVPILVVSSLTAFSWFIGLMLTVIREFKGLIIGSVIAGSLCIFGSTWFIANYGINGVNIILIISLMTQIVIMSIFMYFKILSIRSTN